MADRKPKVAVGYVHRDELAHSFVDSLMALVAFDRAADGLLCHDYGRISVRGGTDGLVAARNMIAQRVVDSDVDWLLWIDSDMGFEPDALYRLLAVADPVQRPVVGGLCFASRQFVHDGMNGFRTRPLPTIYRWLEVDGERKFTAVPLYPVNELVRCEGTGSAFLLVHRSAFERTGPGWYDRLRGTDGSLLGEDISFCVRLGAADVPIHVHTGVRTTHLKPQWVGEADHWKAYPAPPATEHVAVVVTAPAAGHAESFMASLWASTGLAHAYVRNCTDEAAKDAWSKAGAWIADGDDLRQLAEPWVFLADQEARFRPGWLDHAQHVAGAFGAQVVGVNDLSAPAMAGETASSVLVARSYLADAPLDIPSIIADAQKRGLWSMALGAVVEREVANG